MIFEKIYTEFLKRFACLFVVALTAGLIVACATETEIAELGDEENITEAALETGASEDGEATENPDEEDEKYSKRYSQFKSYQIDRSYVNKVDYPMDVEAYYASRFDNKKKSVKKPSYLATPVRSGISQDDLKKLITRINDADGDLEDMEEELSLLRTNYAEILMLSRYCCSYGYTSTFERIGIGNDYIFKFMIDDKRMYELQNICMLVNDKDIANLLGSVELAVITRDVRNSCVCKNKDNVAGHLELLKAVLQETMLFQKNNVMFRYKNELGETVRNNIGRDVVNLLATLETCP